MCLSPRLLLLLAALSALALPAVVAAATGPKHRIDLRLGTKLTPGKAKANGLVTFTDGGKKVTVNVKVDDLCPNDRHVVRFLVAVTYRDGSKNGTGVIDDRGCRPTTPKTLKWTSLESTSRIRSVRIDFYEHNGRTMQIGDFHDPLVLRP